MSKVVMGIGFMIMLVFFMTIYTGYTALSTAGTQLTSSVKHLIAANVMVPANASSGGGYVNEGLNATNLDLSMTSLTNAVQAAIPGLWAGSQVVLNNGSLVWTVPKAVAQGYGITGPITIGPITESSQKPPTLTTTLAIPVTEHTMFAAWSGVIYRQITLPLAGQTSPLNFVPYVTAAQQARYPVPSQLTGVGVPIGTTPAASSSIAADPPSHAIDGNLNTDWNATGYTGTLTLQFPTLEQLSSVGIAASSLPSTTEQYTVQGETASGSWSTIGSLSPSLSQNNLEYFTMAVTPDQYQAIRFVINGETSWVAINDITLNPPVTNSEIAV